MLNYESGKHQLKFDTTLYDFKSLVEHALLENQVSTIDLESLHKIQDIGSNIEKYRQILFTLFRTPVFQEKYKAFGAHLIDEHFFGKGLIQKTPTVRIQLPGAESTSFHSDGWYGHGKTVRSFWLPLTSVAPGNTLYIADDLSQSKKCMDDIKTARATLDQINNIAKSICSPFTAEYGDILTFSSDMIHGANKNTRTTTRVSFDFRIAPDPEDIGTKPISNFYTRSELTNETTSAQNTTSGKTVYSGITYSNLCGGASAKSQLMLCASFCESHNIGIIGNESEIVTFDYLPVLRHYLSDHQQHINCIAVFGIDIFNHDIDLAKSIMETARNNRKTIIFCAESIFMSNEIEESKILDLISKKSN